MLCSEDQGTDTQVRPDMFDTKPPLNIDSDDLAPGLTDVPFPQSRFTDITLCIIQYEIMTNLSWAAKSFGSDSSRPSTQKGEELLSGLAAGVEERFLRKFHLNAPIQWAAAVIARLTLSKASLINRLYNSALDKHSTATDDEIFNMAVEILKFASLLQNDEMSAQWAWICKSYQQQHVVALVLSELCDRPISPETNLAWDLVKGIHDEWQREKQETNIQLQEPLSLLMERASISRQKKLV
jgi:hypothetical protein